MSTYIQRPFLALLHGHARFQLKNHPPEAAIRFRRSITCSGVCPSKASFGVLSQLPMSAAFITPSRLSQAFDFGKLLFSGCTDGLPRFPPRDSADGIAGQPGELGLFQTEALS